MTRKGFGLLWMILCVPAAVIFLKLPDVSEFIKYGLSFVGGIILIALYISFGIRTLKFLGFEHKGTEKYVYSMSVSLIVLGTLMFFVSLAGILNPVFAFAFAFMITVLSRRELVDVFYDVKEMINSFSSSNITLASGIFKVILFIMGSYIFICVAVPPIYYDSLVYHLGVPANYIASGGAVEMNNNIFSYFPKLMQMNYIFFMLLLPVYSVKFLTVFMAVLVIFAVSKMTDAAGGDRRIAVLLTITSTLFVLNSIRITSELPFTMITVSLIMFAFIEKDIKNIRSLIFAALLAGGVMAVKYTGVVIYGMFLMWTLYLMFRNKLSLKYIAVAITLPLLPVLPYLVFNFMQTGNPVYPFLTNVFNTGQGSEAASYIAHVSGYGPEKNILLFFTAPFYAAFGKNVFGGDAVSSMLAFVMILMFFVRPKKVILLSLFIFLYYISWFFGGSVLRFLLPCIPVAAVLAGYIYSNSGTKIKYPVVSLILISQLVITFYFTGKHIEPFEPYLGNSRKYISQKVTYYEAAEFMNNYKGKTGKVMFIGEARNLYAEFRTEAYTVFNSFQLDNIISSPAFPENIRAKGITHVIINFNELNRLKNSGYEDIYSTVYTPVFKNIMDKEFKNIYSDNNCRVFKIND